MTFITDAAFIRPSTPHYRAEDLGEFQAYRDARDKAAKAALSAEPKVVGSARLARLLGISARLQREIHGSS